MLERPAFFRRGLLVGARDSFGGRRVLDFSFVGWGEVSTNTATKYSTTDTASCQYE